MGREKELAFVEHQSNLHNIFARSQRRSSVVVLPDDDYAVVVCVVGNSVVLVVCTITYNVTIWLGIDNNRI